MRTQAKIIFMDFFSKSEGEYLFHTIKNHIICLSSCNNHKLKFALQVELEKIVLVFDFFSRFARLYFSNENDFKQVQINRLFTVDYRNSCLCFSCFEIFIFIVDYPSFR